MRMVLTAALVGLFAAVLTCPALAAEEKAAAQVPKAKAVTVARKSMAEKGSYHRVHAIKEKLDCDDCHDKEALPDNTLKLGLHQPLAKGSPGPVNNDSCHECHGKPGKKTTWYAPKPK
ncbi:MAG: hypothetical protein ABI831_03320 [Betaproteobacteria bacterium]